MLTMRTIRTSLAQRKAHSAMSEQGGSVATLTLGRVQLDELIAMAESVGIFVAWRPLRRAAYIQHSASLVVLSTRAPQWKARCALAHELGHEHHQHAWSRDHDQARDEREADQYAARLLITADDYAVAEELCGSHAGALARELGVTRRLVELRQADFARDVRILETVEQWRADTWAS